MKIENQNTQLPGLDGKLEATKAQESGLSAAEAAKRTEQGRANAAGAEASRVAARSATDRPKEKGRPKPPLWLVMAVAIRSEPAATG